MYQFIKTWLELKTDKRAVTALEYGLIAAVVAGAAVTAFTTLGTSLSTKITSLAGSV